MFQTDEEEHVTVIEKSNNKYKDRSEAEELDVEDAVLSIDTSIKKSSHSRKLCVDNEDESSKFTFY